jgi:two-component system OmpR family sensor kinase
MLLVVTVIVSVSTIYYNSSKERIDLQYKSLMQEFAFLQLKKLKWLHNHYPKYKKYPRDNRYNSAIYDLEYSKIFSTLKSKEIYFNKRLYFSSGNAIYVEMLSDYYLGAKYLFIEVPINGLLISKVYKNIAIYALLALVILYIIGYYLARLFIKPMRDSIELLDCFIKDTTHEINTPIAIINSNIEMLKKDALSQRDAKKIDRIKIASRTLENIYKDLKFTALESMDKVESYKFNLKELLQERVEYFAMHIESKRVKINLDLEDYTINADRELYARMLDNIISNAIKYNRVGGSIGITLKDSKLIIEDSGIGLEGKDILEIFNRYSRFNDSEGGFGIGLSIVKKIADFYSLDIRVESEKNIGTRFIIRWQKD